MNPTAVQAIIIDGACLWGARQVKSMIAKLRQDRKVVILNRMDLNQPAADSTPVAALFLICRELGVEPRQCLIIDHDHRRAALAGLLGFQPVLVLTPGGHARKLLTSGLLARQDLEARGLTLLNCLSEVTALLRLPKRAA